jgi:hypothetical protein
LTPDQQRRPHEHVQAPEPARVGRRRRPARRPRAQSPASASPAA